MPPLGTLVVVPPNVLRIRMWAGRSHDTQSVRVLPAIAWGRTDRVGIMAGIGLLESSSLGGRLIRLVGVWGPIVHDEVEHNAVDAIGSTSILALVINAEVGKIIAESVNSVDGGRNRAEPLNVNVGNSNAEPVNLTSLKAGLVVQSKV